MWTAEIFHRLIGVSTALAVATLYSLPIHAADIHAPEEYPTILAAIDAAAAGDTETLDGQAQFSGVRSDTGCPNLDNGQDQGNQQGEKGPLGRT